MGCDIHVFIEAKTYSGWHCVTHPRIDRWYSLFARMADVRNWEPDSPHYIKPVSPARGLPDDVTDVVRILLDDGNHSHSWLSSTEWESIESDERYRKGLTEVVPWELSDKSCRDHRILDYRIVFAFDN